MRGFVRVSAAVPQVKVTDFEFNREQILALWEKACRQKSILVCFPELSITAYTAKDLFSNTFLLQEAENSLKWLLEKGRDLKTIAIAGMPLIYEHGLYNCAVAIQGKQILCVVPKSYLPNYGEFEEGRWFKPGRFIPSGRTKQSQGRSFTLILLGLNILLILQIHRITSLSELASMLNSCEAFPSWLYVIPYPF